VRSRGKALEGGLGTKSPEADNVLLISVIMMDFGERCKHLRFILSCAEGVSPMSINFSSDL